MSETITVEFRVNQKFETEIDKGELLDALCNMPLTRRWSIVASLLNQIQLYEMSELDNQQRKTILSWLEFKVDKFKAELLK